MQRRVGDVDGAVPIAGAAPVEEREHVQLAPDRALIADAPSRSHATVLCRLHQNDVAAWTRDVEEFRLAVVFRVCLRRQEQQKRLH